MSSQKVELKLFSGNRNSNGSNGGNDISSSVCNQRRVIVVGNGSSSLGVDDEKVFIITNFK